MAEWAEAAQEGSPSPLSDRKLDSALCLQLHALGLLPPMVLQAGSSVGIRCGDCRSPGSPPFA